MKLLEIHEEKARKRRMDTTMISGHRALDFLKEFDFIREAGTEGERRAAGKIREWLERNVTGNGISLRTESFPFEESCVTQARLIVTEPYCKEYLVTGCRNCGSTSDEGVEAPFLYAENADDISLSGAGGKIVMVSCSVSREMYRKLVQAGAAGFVQISGTPLDEAEDRIPARRSVRGVKSTPIQGVTVHCTDAAEMVENGASRARLVLAQEKRKKTSENIILRIEGSDHAEEVLTVSAHYDSVPEGPGAYDNMAGAAIVMELCRYFSVCRPRRTIEFLWFGAEEKGLFGSLFYVKKHEEQLKNHRFNMNVDLAGQTLGGTVMGVTADPKVCHILSCFAHEAGMGVSFKNQIWGSDSNSFAWKGVPAMTLNRDGFGMHTRHDTVALISAWSLERSSCLLGMTAERLANAEVFPFEREVPEKFQRELDEYFTV